MAETDVTLSLTWLTLLEILSIGAKKPGGVCGCCPGCRVDQPEPAGRTRLNAELRQVLAENTQMLDRLRAAGAELTRSNQELEQFAYVASHDLQEPLRKVSSFAQLLAAQYQGKLDAHADEFIGYMVDGAQRMQTLIQNLLAYSRLGRKGQPFAPADGNAVLKQALANLQGAIEESGAVVTSAPLPTVLADEVQLVQLFQNLIGNAIKFRGAEKPRIQVGAEPTARDGPSPCATTASASTPSSRSVSS